MLRSPPSVVAWELCGSQPANGVCSPLSAAEQFFPHLHHPGRQIGHSQIRVTAHPTQSLLVARETHFADQPPPLHPARTEHHHPSRSNGRGWQHAEACQDCRCGPETQDIVGVVEDEHLTCNLLWPGLRLLKRSHAVKRLRLSLELKLVLSVWEKCHKHEMICSQWCENCRRKFSIYIAVEV